MNENGSSKPQPQSSAMNWTADFLKPINIIFLLVSVLSIVITIIIYTESRQESHISYYIATLQLVDQKEPGSFSVLDSVGRPVKENIYATNVTVWNSGDLPLEPDKIRNPLQILLTGGDTRVLDARVDYSTNNNISNFGFTETYKNIGGKEIKINENGVTEIHWKHFDPGEGFRFKIIYESREMQMVMLKGVILGIKNFSDITPPPKGTISFKAPGFVQTAIAGVFSVALIITAVVVRIRRRGQQQSPTQRFVLFGIMGGTVLFQLWASFAILRPPSPPF